MCYTDEMRHSRLSRGLSTKPPHSFTTSQQEIAQCNDTERYGRLLLFDRSKRKWEEAETEESGKMCLAWIKPEVTDMDHLCPRRITVLLTVHSVSRPLFSFFSSFFIYCSLLIPNLIRLCIVEGQWWKCPNSSILLFPLTIHMHIHRQKTNFIVFTYYLWATYCFSLFVCSRLGTCCPVKVRVQLKYTFFIYVNWVLLSAFGRLWIPWHGEEPSVAQMSWTVAPPGHLTLLRGVPSPRGSPHSALSPASAPGIAAFPNARGSPLPAWVSELRPTCWRCVGFPESVCVCVLGCIPDRNG